MKAWARVMVISLPALGAAYVGFMWFAFGGLETFQPPFEIVVPQNVHGVVCATSRQGTVEDIKHAVRHEVTTEGLLEVDGDILRSHRPRKVLRRSMDTGQLTESSGSGLLSIYTENDPATGQWYSVMWLGTADEWNVFRAQAPSIHHCLGRFGKSKAE